MCRSIKRLRTEGGPAADDEIEAAALQFVRKVSGFRAPSRAHEDAFQEAVRDIAVASKRLLETLPPKKAVPSKEG